MLKHKTIKIISLLFLLNFNSYSQTSNSLLKGDSLFNLGHYAEALNEELKSLNSLSNSNNCLLLSLTHLKIGRLYYYLQNKKTAIDWFRKSNRFAESCHLDSLLGKNYRNIGAIYCEMALKDSSMYYLNKARFYLKSWNKHKELSTLYALFFELRFRSFNDIKGGEAYLDTCEYYSKKENDPNTYAFYLTKRGIFLMETDRCSSAIKYLKEAKDTYQSINQIDGQMYALICMASAYRNCKEADSCHKCYEQYTDLRDNIFKQKTAENLAKYQSLFETQKKEMENLELKRKNQLLFWLILIGVIITTGVSFVIYKIKSTKKQKKFDEELREQQRIRFLEVLQAQEQERTRIASDLHDGVGHLLSAIKLNVSALSKENTDDIKITNNLSEIIDTASSEVRQISHQLMPQSLTELDLLASLNELANRINKSNSIVLSIKSNTELISLTKKSQIVVYRIIQEILNNILKHAEAKTIHIALALNEPKLTITISDDGKFFNSSQINQSQGIGWKNIKARIELFNGTYKINSSAENGTELTVTLFPDFEITT
jgi:two-component system NarL family sensor kinase